MCRTGRRWFSWLLLPLGEAIAVPRYDASMRLRDKVIIVTGSTTGIGAAMARRFVAEGARVLVHGLERDLGERVIAELGASASLHVDDLADPAAPRRIIDAAIHAFWRIDGLVNNAAWIVRSNIETTD